MLPPRQLETNLRRGRRASQTHVRTRKHAFKLTLCGLAGVQRAHHLTTGVYALVGAPGDSHSHGVAAVQLRQRAFDLILPTANHFSEARCSAFALLFCRGGQDKHLAGAACLPLSLSLARSEPGLCARSVRRPGTGSRGSPRRRTQSCT